jgi:DNA-binding response OmpR family regulator
MSQRVTVDVLVIEDGQHVADLLADVLSDEGYRVALASDGPRGLEYVARYQPRLVLCDVMLPGLSGLDIVNRLREQGDQRPVIVLMSAASLPATPPPDVPFIGKPFDVDELLARVRAILQAPRSDPTAT